MAWLTLEGMKNTFLKHAGYLWCVLALPIVFWLLFQRYFGQSRTQKHQGPEKQFSGDSPVVKQLPRESTLRQDLQTLSSGVGPIFHRRYQVHICKAQLSPVELMNCIRAQINHFVPPELARFEKTLGHPQHFAPGDHHQIHILGPWNGPVKTLHNADTHFVFGTLKGHLEAGEIHFKAHSKKPGELFFEIHSWSRSKDEWVDLAYDKTGVAQEAQTAMWVFFCKKVVEVSQGKQHGEIDVFTERRETEAASS